jgi:beta-glucosidase
MGISRRELIKKSAMASALLGLSPQMFAQIVKDNPGFSKTDFGKDFLWGVATAAYQIEGAWDADGKSPSIWDTFSNYKNGKKIKNRDNGNIACDFYNRYNEDIAFIKQMNMQVNRFSLSWSRIKPQGTGTINQKGVDFYHRLIDRTLELGLQPWITLYHWDLPQILEDKGGWVNRDVINWFSEYTEFCTKEYGDKVKDWMILNEPMAFTGAGYMVGVHAPGKKGLKNFIPAVHHATMCQAEGGRIVRNMVKDANIGSTFSVSYVEPKNDKGKNQRAATRLDALINRLFIEPSLGMGYPLNDFKGLRMLDKYIKDGDEQKLAFDFDFHGLQNYTRNVARHALFPPVLWANEVPPKKRGVEEITEMNWEVYPEGIYHLLKRFGEYKGVKNVIVTENGAAFPDVVNNGEVNDSKRVKFLQDYLKQVLRAKQEGVPVNGYFVWSLMDNFEWAEGYHPRFGLVHVDFETQKRTLKDSGKWFSEFLRD